MERVTSKLAGRNILVTGGTGFVGSHLVEALAGSGARVIVPFRSIDPRSYFATQGLDKKVIMVSGDVTDRRRIIDIVTKYEIEDIFHLAAQPLVDVAFHNPVETIQTNIMGATNILNAAWVSGTVRRIIMTSSDKAYGKSITDYSESSALLGDHPYEVSKAAADMVTRAYAVTYKAPVVTVRFGNIYGPGDLNMSRIIPGLMRSAVTGDTLHVRSDGTFVRDYVYVDDVVSAYLFLEEHIPEVAGEVFNVASDQSVSVVDLIRQVETIVQVKIPFVVDNSQKNEIPRQHLSWEKIQKLGWKPTHSFEKSIRTTFRWYQSLEKLHSFL